MADLQPFMTPQRQRWLGRDYMPSSIKPRSLQLIQKTGKTTSSVSVADGVKFVNTITLKHAQAGTLLMAKIYRTVWLDSVAGVNWFMQGANVNPTNFDVYSEHGAYYVLDSATNTLNELDNEKDQSVFFCKNRDGSTHTFIIDGLVRYIVNNGGVGNL